MSSEKKQLLSTAMKRTSEWIFSQEIPSDMTINVGEASFSLHKFPLISKCGYIRKLVSEPDESDFPPSIAIADLPGGADAFELAAKFCYGINFEMGAENISTLRCVAEYLEMTEDYAVGNLVSRTETYINDVALKSLSGAVSVLQSCENLFPIADKVKLVSRCIDMIAFVACKDSQFAGPVSNFVSTNSRPIVHWWAEDLTVLRIDLFQRVLIAMMARGFKQFALGPILTLYAQKSLRGLDIFGKARKKIDPREEHEKRVILETIVSLLPREPNTMSISFLSLLLRSSIYLETTVACRLDLEKRMALQLGQAALEDLLIPSYSLTGDTLFDVDTVQRIMINFFEYEAEGNGREEEHVSPSPGDAVRVTKSMESYIAEIASDRNLSVAKFVSLSELIPEHSKVAEDGMYRAIDIYLKAHPALSDMERKKVCSVMDCRKLSREACSHAAQNDRLPVQTVVQVLYYEQQRLREAVDGGDHIGSPSPPARIGAYSVDVHPVTNEVSSLTRENHDLKMELLKMKMRLKELDKNSIKVPSAVNRSSTPSPAGMGKPPLPKKSFMSSVSKTLGKLMRPDGLSPGPKGKTRPSKDRRHSIS